MHLLDPAQYRRTPWKNGGGVTVDIALAYDEGAAPGDWTGMLWRFGRTRIERPGPFSDLSGYDRLLAVIEGDGLLLHVRGGPTLDVRRSFEPVRFDGAWPIESDLTAGPVGVLNLMADRTRYAIALSFLEPGGEAMAGPAVVVVWAADAAEVSIDDLPVTLGDDWSCRLDAEAPRRIACRKGRVAVACIALRR